MNKILYGKEKLPPVPNLSEIFRGFIGGCLSIVTLLLIGKYTGYLWIMAPFGASCVLLYAASQSPLAQPRNLILGHLLSAFTGLLFLKFFGANIWTIACATGCAIALMQLFQAVHPPAGANPLVILLSAGQTEYGWSFLIFPVLSGAILLVSIAYLINNIRSTAKWPLYGLAILPTKK